MKYIYLFLIFMTMQNIATAQNNSERFTYTVGSIKVTLLNENQGTADTTILIDATSEMLDKTAPDRKIPNAVNAFLIQNGDKNILVDAGFGSKLIDNLAELGVKPEEIHIILLTHMHGDHIGGLLKDGQAAFPNAKLHFSSDEYIYWAGDEVNNKLALDVLSAYNGRTVFFTPGTLDKQYRAIIPNIKAFQAYGHTPGHTMYLIESDNHKLLIWGDLTHALAVQIPYPEVAVTYDVDPEQAVKSRLETLKYVSENNIPVAGMHIPYSGMGRVSVDEKGAYQFKFITNKKIAY